MIFNYYWHDRTPSFLTIENVTKKSRNIFLQPEDGWLSRGSGLNVVDFFHFLMNLIILDFRTSLCISACVFMQTFWYHAFFRQNYAQTRKTQTKQYHRVHVYCNKKRHT